ncbi:MAG: ParB/RepB/Spo0J family partition protein [Gammaproteobacteria bacterium]
MDNRKRNVHNSGPLGMLVKSGQVKKIEDEDTELPGERAGDSKINVPHFKTQTGVEFTEQELVYVDPKECEPWKYANRQEGELGDMDGLIESIKLNKQLQPALIRTHPHPHEGIKYEIIFGRRRHLACIKLGVPFLAIRKEIANVQDAIASQDAENKLRDDVSNYSNAKLYQRLLVDNVFKNEKELAEKLQMSTSSLNDLMAYTKIPADIVNEIPNIHALSKNIVLKIMQLLNKSKMHHSAILSVAAELGNSITSSAKLEHAVVGQLNKKTRIKHVAKFYKSNTGTKLFTFKMDQRGSPCLVINKELTPNIQVEDLCGHLCKYLENKINQSGYPD